MGNKVEAKALMAEAGVPVLPGVDARTDTSATPCRAAATVGYPLLVKAAFGGGGRGMRIVARPRGARRRGRVGAQREAAAAFGDGRVFLERYVDDPRHIEVQVFGDTHGNVVHLFERECSIQRRHQKVIEEAPSPAVDEALRARLGEAAVAAGAGDRLRGRRHRRVRARRPTGEFFFLEVNTRLQVEHPVTELITGLDLVRLQLAVGAGRAAAAEALDGAIARPCHRGPAVRRGRAAGFLPTSGRFDRFRVPRRRRCGSTADTRRRRRVDVYDAMLAKVIAWAPTRDEAAAAWPARLARRRLHGCRRTATCSCARSSTRSSSRAHPTPASTSVTIPPARGAAPDRERRVRPRRRARRRRRRRAGIPRSRCSLSAGATSGPDRFRTAFVEGDGVTVSLRLGRRRGASPTIDSGDGALSCRRSPPPASGCEIDGGWRDVAGRANRV